MTAAERIGQQLRKAMTDRGLTPETLAKKTGKQHGQIEAVLAGYPNTAPGETMLDTVDDIATALGHRLEVV